MATQPSSSSRLATLKDRYPGWLFAISVVPGLLAAAAVLVLVRESPRQRAASARGLDAPMRTLAFTPGPFRRLLVAGLYGLGNFSATLLILRATQLLDAHGRTNTAAAVAVLLYAGHNAANSAAAYPAGVLADRIGRRPVLAAGIILFAVACTAFAAGTANIAVLAVLFAAVGASTALVETAQAAYAPNSSTPTSGAAASAWPGLVDGIGDLISSLAVGLLFTLAGPAWGFTYAAALATGGAATLLAHQGSAQAAPSNEPPA